jgi:hypothetical protein
MKTPNQALQPTAQTGVDRVATNVIYAIAEKQLGPAELR